MVMSVLSLSLPNHTRVSTPNRSCSYCNSYSPLLASLRGVLFSLLLSSYLNKHTLTVQFSCFQADKACSDPGDHKFCIKMDTFWAPFSLFIDYCHRLALCSSNSFLLLSFRSKCWHIYGRFSVVSTQARNRRYDLFTAQLPVKIILTVFLFLSSAHCPPNDVF